MSAISNIADDAMQQGSQQKAVVIARGGVIASILVLAMGAACAWHAHARSDLVKFPSDYLQGVRYATIERGNLREEIFTSKATIDAVKKGQSIPSGAIITLVDYRDGALCRYVVMEKRTGWGTDYPPALRNGEWEYQSFNADTSVKVDGQPDRCMSCHKAREQQDFVWTIDQMRKAQ